MQRERREIEDERRHEERALRLMLEMRALPPVDGRRWVEQLFDYREKPEPLRGYWSA